MEDTARKEIILRVVMAFCVAALFFAVAYFALKAKPEPSLMTKEQKVSFLEEKKARILEKVYSTTTLSTPEKKEIFDSIGNNKIHDYNLTKEEKFKLIETFNKK